MMPNARDACSIAGNNFYSEMIIENARLERELHEDRNDVSFLLFDISSIWHVRDAWQCIAVLNKCIRNG